MTLTIGTAALVLLAAVLHATWNAFVKAGSDKVAMQTGVIFFSGLPAVAALPFLPFPAAASWPFLVMSTVVHGVYYVTLINAYRHGDLSQVYPIARGAAPLLVALGAWAFAGEALRASEAAGIAILSIGIISLASPGRIARERELRGVGFALATSVTIALYSVADGLGVRSTPDPMSYIAWLLAIESPILLAVGLWLRRGRFLAAYRPLLGRLVLGGIAAAIGYGIVIWAMRHAAMAHVSALRETSVVLAAVIGTLFLGEPFGRRRIAAAALVAAGSALMHLGG